jgi:trehalose-phosphatase
MLTRGRVLLCLDYDGTLSEIVPHPADARPLDGVVAALTALTLAPDRLNVAIISGRELVEVREILNVQSGLLFSGTHGLEMVGIDGVCRIAPGVEAAEQDLARARRWLIENVAPRNGFVVEDKGIAVGMHYRMADPAEASLCRIALRTFVEAETPSLRILEGKMIDELLPRGIGGKGRAIRILLAELGEPPPTAIYFGDDATDEDAFHELRDDGIGILVGPARASWARFRVDRPSDVLLLLNDMARELDRVVPH